MNSRKKTVIFQCNSYTDGYGDIGNLIDVAREVINHIGEDNITPYFVITAEIMLSKEQIEKLPVSLEEYNDKNALPALEDAVKRFKQDSKYVFKLDSDSQIYSFTHPQYKTSKYQSLDEFIEDNQSLKKIYANADIIFTIATPFPKLNAKEKSLNKNVEIFNITEHCNASHSGPSNSYPHLNHYVTGISKDDSGLMVSNKECDPIQALKSMTDISYLEKLGLKTPLSDNDASRFIRDTLVVPVYLGESQKQDLAPLIHFVSQSPLASKFHKIIFHVNKRVYDEKMFNEMNAALDKKPGTPDIQLIIGHYFENPDDFQRVFQLGSGRGIAIVSSDKVLELAISCDLLPLYPPVDWKRPVHRSLHEFVDDDSDLNKLFIFLGKTSALKKNKDSEHQTMMLAIQDDESVTECLSMNTIYAWREGKRPLLLENSFYNVLHNEILNHQPPHALQQKTKNALKVMQKDIFNSKFSFSENYLLSFFETSDVGMGTANNTISSWAKKILDEIDGAQKGKQTYISAFIHSLITIILASEDKNDKNAEIANNMLKHLDLNVEKALFYVKNYLMLSPELTCITDDEKTKLAKDWFSELKFIWTKSSDEQLDMLKKVIVWANQLPEHCRYGVLQCICKELKLDDVTLENTVKQSV